MKNHKHLLRRTQKRSHFDPSDLTDKTAEAVHKLGEQATALAQSLADQAATSATAGAERAKEAGATIAASAKDHAPHVSGVSHKVTDDVVPALKDVATQAAALALDLWQATRERAAEAAEMAHHDLAPHAAGVVGAAEKRASEATAAVKERSEEVVSRTKEASKHAAHATVDTGKETGALLFWAGAAAGLVLFAMMGKERRDQVLKAAESSIVQIREIMRDFQGYDEEFKKA